MFLAVINRPLFSNKKEYIKLRFILSYTTYEEGTECSETSAHTFQAPGDHQKERLQDSSGMSVRLPDCISLALTGQAFVHFNTEGYYKNLSRKKFKFGSNRT